MIKVKPLQSVADADADGKASARDISLNELVQLVEQLRDRADAQERMIDEGAQVAKRLDEENHELRDRVDAQEKEIEEGAQVAKRLDEDNHELRDRVGEQEKEMKRSEQVTKQLQKENQELRDRADVQGNELYLIKQSLVKNQATGNKLELELDPSKAPPEHFENEVQGEEEEEEDLWALVSLPRPADVSAGWAAMLAYTYTFAMAAPNGLALFALMEWFPVTDFESLSGVPAMKVGVLLSRWFPVYLGSYVIGTSFNVIAQWESGVRNGHPWDAAWPAFPICIFNGALWYGTYLAVVAALRANRIDPIYFARFDIPLVFVFMILYIFTSQVLMRKGYVDWGWYSYAETKEEGGKKSKEEKESIKDKTESNTNEKTNESSDTKKKEKMEKGKEIDKNRRRSSLRSSVVEDEIRRIQEDDVQASVLSSLILIFGATFNAILYPTLIVPFLNADTTSDNSRIIIISVVLSALTEGTLIVMRFGSIMTSDEDFNIRAAVCSQNALLIFESFTILARRILLGCMRSQSSVFVAIGIMSLEEAVLRSTFAAREMWYRKFRKQQPLSEAELARLKVGWAVQIANSMHCEIFSILMAKFLVIASR